jgi:hypothetical protein
LKAMKRASGFVEVPTSVLASPPERKHKQKERKRCKYTTILFIMNAIRVGYIPAVMVLTVCTATSADPPPMLIHLSGLGLLFLGSS